MVYLPTISIEQITNLYLYGQLTRPNNLTDDIWIREPNPVDEKMALVTVETDAVARVGRTRLRYAA